MGFHKRTIATVVAITAFASAPSTTLASTRYDLITQQLGQPTTAFSSATRSTPAILASSRYDLIIQQLGRQTTTSQPTRPQTAATPDTPLPSSNGQAFFQHAPRLVRVASSDLGGNRPATYEFTLTIPANAGQPLKAIAIAQAANLETVEFDLTQSKAFAGNRFAAGPEIVLASVGGTHPTNAGEVMVVFDQPVQPGSTVTVAIAAKANPNYSGTYEFGLTAYPAGENGLGQFLGYGRLNFYGNSN